MVLAVVVFAPWQVSASWLEVKVALKRQELKLFQTEGKKGCCIKGYCMRNKHFF